MKLQPRIWKTLWSYQFQRLVKNVPALMLLGLLVALALLMALSKPQPSGGIAPCWVVYWEESPWIEHLRRRVPSNVPIRVVHERDVLHRGGELVYPRGCHSIQILPPDTDSQGRRRERIAYLYSGPDRNAIWPYASWFWAATREHFDHLPAFLERQAPLGGRSAAAALANLKEASVADLVSVESVGTMLVFFTLFFTCVHLLVSTTSQEHESGTLLALALTPAGTLDILLAKISFHLLLALATCAVIIAALKPSALAEPLLWLTLIGGALGYISIALAIAALFRTQATAGLMTLSYMLTVGIVLYLVQQYTTFAQVQHLLIERYLFALVYVGLKTPLGIVFPAALGWLYLLAAGWTVLASWLFATRGWR